MHLEEVSCARERKPGSIVSEAPSTAPDYPLKSKEMQPSSSSLKMRVPWQAALDKAKAAEAEAAAQMAALEQHKSSMELENADLKRQCRDLQQQVASLSVWPGGYLASRHAVKLLLAILKPWSSFLQIYRALAVV